MRGLCERVLCAFCLMGWVRFGRLLGIPGRSSFLVTLGGLCVVLTAGCLSTPAIVERSDQQATSTSDPETAKLDWEDELLQLGVTKALGDQNWEDGPRSFDFEQAETLQLAERLAAIHQHRDLLDAEHQGRLDELDHRLHVLQTALKQRAWEAWSQRVDQLINARQWPEAEAALKEIPPPPVEGFRVAYYVENFRQRIEQGQQEERPLREAIDQLASDEPASRQGSQEVLWQNPSLSATLLAESLKKAALQLQEPALDQLNSHQPGWDEPSLLKQAVFLGRLRQPGPAVQVVTSLLGQPDGSPLWPAAVQVSTGGGPEVGRALVTLIGRARTAEQQAVILDALAACQAPPPEALLAVVPVVLRDSPALASALQAATKVVCTNKQVDVLSRRGLGRELNPIDHSRLDQLPDRLRALTDPQTGPEAGPQTAVPLSVRQAAIALSVAIRLKQPQPLSEVTIHSVSGESPQCPASNLLDGEFAATAVGDQWWDRDSQSLPWVVFDLGSRRSVAAVRIGNVNHPDSLNQGLRDVAVYVGDSPGQLRQLVQGTIQRGTGQPQQASQRLPNQSSNSLAADSRTVLPVPLFRGRYLRIQALSTWDGRPEGGLCEVQVLGF